MNHIIEELRNYSENSPTIVKIVGVFPPFRASDKEIWLMRNGQIFKVYYTSEKIPIPIEEIVSVDEFINGLKSVFNHSIPCKVSLSVNKQAKVDDRALDHIVATTLDSFLSQVSLFLKIESTNELNTI